MTSNLNHRTFRAAVEKEIAVLEEACNGLREDSHLRTLCNVATEHLRALLPGEKRAAATPRVATPRVATTAKATGISNHC